MAAIYNILARSGSNGELIQKLFWEFGLSCEYNIQPNIPKIKNAVVVTYGYDLLPYVMTSHLLEVVGDAYAEGNKEVWDQFKEHYSGSGIYDNPNDITPEHWAEHVKNSMNFIISNFNLFNGNADSVLELIEGYTGPKYNIKLEDILLSLIHISEPTRPY